MIVSENKEYYLGLDVGTDSVGYAATDAEYQLLKFKGEPVWGVTTFETASLAQERRAFRTQRRRLDRRKQRIKLLEEVFAGEISKIDPRFFIRRRESALCRNDKEEPFALFSGSGYTDKEYARQYPTIHHLIVDLMSSKTPHDVRLLFHACAWLVAHRGHFLFDVAPEDAASLLDFDEVYGEICRFFTEELSCALPWDASISPKTILDILQKKVGVGKKEEAFKAEVFCGRKPPKDADEVFPFSRAAIMSLLCGRTVQIKDLFCSDSYADLGSVKLTMDDEEFASVMAELGDDGEILRKLRKLTDCAMLITASNGKTISAAKVDIYDQHKNDLQLLKRFVKKYLPTQYNTIFRRAEKDNYVAYSGNVKSCRKPELVKRSGKDAFCAFLKKQLKDVVVDAQDKDAFDDMLVRLDSFDFLPKQRDTDNRIIPQQLYRIELDAILRQASAYLPFLNKKDTDGYTIYQKILSVFDFKIPYYVGPLGKNGRNIWFARKAEGKIYPWNFAELVDLDASEEAFIKRMTNTCTYLPGEDVLPVASLLYSRFTVLNEINNLMINGIAIPVEVKQLIYTELFEKNSRVSVPMIKELLRSRGLLSKDDALSGIDEKIKSSLRSQLAFAALTKAGTLTDSDVECIIERAAYSEEKARLRRWLANHYPQLTEDERKYISSLNLKGFGRLSGKLLAGLYGADNATGEARTIIEAMWDTNENLMQLLSDRYSYREAIENAAREFYGSRPLTLNERLSEMYVSNAVKRPIIRALDVTSDVVKAMGCAPKKIFIEMARGGTPEQKGKRTKTRKQQLLELYDKIKTDDARDFAAQLEAMGDMADNRLQSDRLFLYYLQLGKCLYTGEPIDISRLTDGTYNIEHIYPQSLVKDDSILNNEILVRSEINGQRQVEYPIPTFIRTRMRSMWDYLKAHGLMTEEKHRRLTRQTGFTEEERMGFISRQLVETRQSTKAVAELLREKYPSAEIVYVKAGLVSEFRQEFDLLKCRAVNDLHHAKDAYLNIVVGNVYHERFSKRWFTLDKPYNVQVKKIFTGSVVCGGKTVWNAGESLASVRKTALKNAVHLTRYAFCRKGGFFDQQPVKAGVNLIPLKKGLPTELYGGYNKPTASFFLLVRFKAAKKTDIAIIPVELLKAEKVLASRHDAAEYARHMLGQISGKKIDDVELLLNARPLKINTAFSLDGITLVLSGKSSGGKQIILSCNTPLILSKEEEDYVKRLDAFCEKRSRNASILPDEEHDGISAAKNTVLYETLKNKLATVPFSKLPANQYQTLVNGKDKFAALPAADQIRALRSIVDLFGAASVGSDLSPVGGSKNAGVKLLSYCMSNWKRVYTDVRIRIRAV